MSSCHLFLLSAYVNGVVYCGCGPQYYGGLELRITPATHLRFPEHSARFQHRRCRGQIQEVLARRNGTETSTRRDWCRPLAMTAADMRLGVLDIKATPLANVCWQNVQCKQVLDD